MEDSNSEIEGLLKRVEETDFSYKNPLVQKLVEKKLGKWIESWEQKKELFKKGRTMGDCYGELKDMPEKIYFEGIDYTPYEIFDNVKKRTDVGINVIKKIKEYQNEHPIYYEKKFVEILRETIEGVGGDLEKVVMSCMCGEHNKTGRDIINDILNVSEDSIFIEQGLEVSIQRLYSDDLDPIWFLGKPEFKSKVEEKYGSKPENKNIFKKFLSYFSRKEKPFQIY